MMQRKVVKQMTTSVMGVTVPAEIVRVPVVLPKRSYVKSSNRHRVVERVIKEVTLQHKDGKTYVRPLTAIVHIQKEESTLTTIANRLAA